jgi:hypothetical protein
MAVLNVRVYALVLCDAGVYACLGDKSINVDVLGIFWDPLECGGLSVAEGTLIVFLRHPPITV